MGGDCSMFLLFSKVIINSSHIMYIDYEKDTQEMRVFLNDKDSTCILLGGTTEDTFISVGQSLNR